MNKLKRSFSRLFIANRGEISRRIAFSAKKMGLETVCLMQGKPGDAPPRYLIDVIDQFIPVAEENPSLYLNMDKMLGYALEAKCDCLHPGFGFLSENFHFAQKVEEAGLVWIGPPWKAVEAMASKGEARLIAEKLKIPCTKGLENFTPNFQDGKAKSGEDNFSILKNFADKATYPLLVKAALGGGGKGMRLVNKIEELRDAVLRASSEAMNSFGDPSLIVETYISSARHIEVQVLADKHGNVVTLSDRDCSVQRRHQKVLEEAPAIGLNAVVRDKLHEAAKKLAKEVGYESCGTVEFLVPWVMDIPDAEKINRENTQFYFLEMNTRLQVEHTVTEEVLGIDLVMWQLKVAQGAALPESFSNLTPRGHAIEARVYAEDTELNFLPAAGEVLAFIPFSAPRVRWEVGLDRVGEISDRFDPMIAKLIVFAENREEALKVLALTLDRTFFIGPQNNREWLSYVATDSTYAKKAVNTHFIANENTQVLKNLKVIRDTLQEEVNQHKEALESLLRGVSSQLLSATPLSHPLQTLSELAFSLGSAKKVEGKEEAEIKLIDASVLEGYAPHKVCQGSATVLHQGKTVRVYVAYKKTPESERFGVLWRGFAFSWYKEQKRYQAEENAVSAAGSAVTHIQAPVNGKIIKVLLAVKEKSDAQQTLMILESMKMEFEIKLPRNATIASISVKEGEQVKAGQLLAVIE